MPAKGDAAPVPAKPHDPQLAAFDTAMGLFHGRDFAGALPLFEQASQGASRDIAQTALMHLRMCQQRLGAIAPPPLETSEDHYAYGIALLGRRQSAEAERVLSKGAALAPRADHIHYALAVARGQQGDYAGAAASLAHAIELQPANRSAARTDPDFHEILQHSPVRELVYSEKASNH